MKKKKTVLREKLITAKASHADVYLTGSLVEYRGTARVKAGRNVLEIAGIIMGIGSILVINGVNAIR